MCTPFLLHSTKRRVAGHGGSKATTDGKMPAVHYRTVNLSNFQAPQNCKSVKAVFPQSSIVFCRKSSNLRQWRTQLYSSRGVLVQPFPRRDIEALGHMAATAEGVSEEKPGSKGVLTWILPWPLVAPWHRGVCDQRTPNQS